MKLAILALIVSLPAPNVPDGDKWSEYADHQVAVTRETNEIAKYNRSLMTALAGLVCAKLLVTSLFFYRVWKIREADMALIAVDRANAKSDREQAYLDREQAAAARENVAHLLAVIQGWRIVHAADSAQANINLEKQSTDVQKKIDLVSDKVDELPAKVASEVIKRDGTTHAV